jgi:hypothetical protein
MLPKTKTFELLKREMKGEGMADRWAHHKNLGAAKHTSRQDDFVCCKQDLWFCAVSQKILHSNRCGPFDEHLADCYVLNDY